jgi:hypothetical protein
LYESVKAHLPISVKSLELDLFSLQLYLAPWLPDVDHPDTLLVKLGRLAPFDERGGYGQNNDDVEETSSEVEALEALRLGDASPKGFCLVLGS